MNSDDIAFVSVAMLVVAALLLRPLVQALARRLDVRRPEADALVEIAELRERVAELDGAAARIQELEERLDFAERVLARRNDPAQFPPARTSV